MVEAAENRDEPLSTRFSFSSSFFVEAINTKGLVAFKSLQQDKVVGLNNIMDLICGVGGLACEFEAQGGGLDGVQQILGFEGHIEGPPNQGGGERGAWCSGQRIQGKDPVKTVRGPKPVPDGGFGSFPVLSGDFRLSHGVTFGGSRDERVFGRLK